MEVDLVEVPDALELQQRDPNLDTQRAAPSASRSRADRFMHRLLRSSTRRRVDPSSVHRVFSTSMVLSGLRCLFSYVLIPFVVPAIGAFTAPALGIVLSVLALVFDVRGLRRFWIVDHKSRWAMTAVYIAVMSFVLVLLGTDIAHLAS